MDPFMQTIRLNNGLIAVITLESTNMLVQHILTSLVLFRLVPHRMHWYVDKFATETDSAKKTL